MNRNYVLHKGSERGKSDLGWLQSRFSFSFADYYNPTMMGFGALRVLNDDIVAPGKGFGAHQHNDMEIISIPTSGSISHRDSMGNNSIIQAGEVQVMSAGTGVVHSEMNHNPYESAKFFQIWIQTREPGILPNYSQKEFNPDHRKDTIQLLVGPEDNENIVKINQDAYISRVNVSLGNSLEYKKYHSENGIYLFVISGAIDIAEYSLGERDAIGVVHDDTIEIQAKSQSDVLIVEVPMDEIIPL